ncbi:MAG TPA: 4-hydroxythreonine-4-phosphate dehydrogenase PdxA [Candidatus Sumerlaeota bacterium]|nr:4-hydroxythreonine-4-phosphate dehydrogenase PdxA [Candidatus Sumerlaeota bacterium]
MKSHSELNTSAPRVVAVTMGDPAGVGPEIALKALAGWDRASWRPVIIGSGLILRRAASHVNPGADLFRLESLSDAFRHGEKPSRICYLEPDGIPDLSQLKWGTIQAESGLAARMFIDAAVREALKGSAAAVCTGPIHKEAMKRAGFAFPGHTEYLAHLCGTQKFAMLLCGGGLRVALATIHEAVKDVPGLITRELVLERLALMKEFLPLFGPVEPRIAVCGLNPHSGEGGMFGREEIEVIGPAIQRARELGIHAEGPHPADTVFHRMIRGEFDGILAMYHDQGLGPLKTLAFYEGVNITMGLPFIRASVDHGTGFDIAGRGIANAGSMKAALETAVNLAENLNNSMGRMKGTT